MGSPVVLGDGRNLEPELETCPTPENQPILGSVLIMVNLILRGSSIVDLIVHCSKVCVRSASARPCRNAGRCGVQEVLRSEGSLRVRHFLRIRTLGAALFYSVGFCSVFSFEISVFIYIYIDVALSFRCHKSKQPPLHATLPWLQQKKTNV